MNTLNQNELVVVTGGTGSQLEDIWAQQALLDQLALQQEAEFRRFMMGQLAN